MILVTGKPGVGKSTLIRKSEFENVYFMDRIIKDKMYVKPHALFNEVANHFGSEVVKNKRIDTTKLGSIVLKDPKKLASLNSLVQKHVKNFLGSLPKDSIVEFGAYLSQEKHYKKFFSKVILVKNNQPNLTKKFSYLKQKPNFQNQKVDYDYEIEIDFKNFDQSINEFGVLIEKITQNKKA